MGWLVDFIDVYVEILVVIEIMDNGKLYFVLLSYDVLDILFVLCYYVGFVDKNYGKIVDLGFEKLVYMVV